MKLRFVDARHALQYFPDTDYVTNLATGERSPCPDAVMAIVGDLLVVDGRYFGDWTVFLCRASSHPHSNGESP